MKTDFSMTFWFITFTFEMKQFHLFIFFRLLSLSSYQTTVTEHLYFIVDMYVKILRESGTTILAGSKSAKMYRHQTNTDTLELINN
jgi:hypothetical protein